MKIIINFTVIEKTKRYKSYFPFNQIKNQKGEEKWDLNKKH